MSPGNLRRLLRKTLRLGLVAWTVQTLLVACLSLGLLVAGRSRMDSPSARKTLSEAAQSHTSMRDAPNPTCTTSTGTAPTGAQQAEFTEAAQQPIPIASESALTPLR